MPELPARFSRGSICPKLFFSYVQGVTEHPGSYGTSRELWNIQGVMEYPRIYGSEVYKNYGPFAKYIAVELHARKIQALGR